MAVGSRTLLSLVAAALLAAASAPAASAVGLTIRTVAGTGVNAESGNGTPATTSNLRSAIALSAIPSGGFDFAEPVSADVRGVTGSNINRVAGIGTPAATNNPDGPVQLTALAGLTDIDQKPGGGIYVVDSTFGRIRTVAGGFVETVFGQDSNSVIHGAFLDNPTAIAAFPNNSDYVIGESGSTGHGAAQILSVSTFPTLSYSVLGTGFDYIRALVPDIARNVVPEDKAIYALTTEGSKVVVRSIATDGMSGVVAGGGTGGGGSGGSSGALSVDLQDPQDIAPAQALDSFVIAETGANQIDYVHDGVIETIAGGSFICPDPMAPCGDGQDAGLAQLNQPTSVAVTPEGLLIGDSGDHRIRRIDSSTFLGTPPSLSNDSTPTFNYRSWDLHARWECAMDNAGLTPCGPGYTAPPQSDGQHTFSLAYVDPSGIADPTPLTYTWTIDATAPGQPQITTSPADPTSQTSASFTFDVAEPGTGTVECDLDGGGFTACDTESSQAYSALSDGPHTFSVHQIDAAGNVSVEGAYSWTVDTLAPDAPSLGSHPAATTTATSADFTYTPAESGGTMQCKLDASSYVSCDASGEQVYAGPVADGSHTFHVRQVDGAGNLGQDTTWTWTVDTTGPAAPSFGNKPAAATSLTSANFSFTAAESGGSVECKLDTAGYAPCTSPVSFSGLDDKLHSFLVRQTDALGNVGTPAEWDWTVDTVQPAAPSIDTGPDPVTKATTASITFTADEPSGTMQCRLDSAAFSVCTSPAAYTNLADGSHTVFVRQVDAAGNVGATAFIAWKVDTLPPPTPTIDPSSEPAAFASTKSANFAFNFGETGGSAQCALDSATFTGCANHSQSSGSQSYSLLSEGAHEFTVRLVDEAGNVGPTSTYDWTVDTIAPPAPAIDTKPNAVATAVADADFTFHANETLGSGEMRCRLGADTFQPCTTSGTQSYAAPPAPGFPDGPYHFDVEEVDAAGNVSPLAAYDWIVDTGPPNPPTIDTHPTDPTNSTTAAFTFTSAEGGGTMQCSLDGAAFTNCSSHGQQSYPGLTEGAHSFAVKQLDVANNFSLPRTFSWTIDLTPPPAPALDSPADGAGGQPPRPSFSWAPVSGASRYELMIDGKAAAEVASCASSCTAAAPTDLEERAHPWKVRAFDSVGNSAESATRSFSVAVAPVADIVASPNPVLSGRTATFDGSKSTDYGTGVADYAWDLDGDGTFETDTGASPATTRTYALPASIKVSLRVTDGVGMTSEASTLLNVTALPQTGKPVGISINDGAQYTNNPKVTLFSVWPSFATTMLVANDGGFGNAQTSPVSAQLPWQLDSSGPERLPKTVYVRFQANTPTTQNFTDDIILDQTPPKVVSAVLSGTVTGAGARAAKARTVTLKLKATDNVSGVAGVQVTANKRKPGKLLKYKAKLKIPAGKKLVVRVQDRAGNFSSWKPVRKG